MASTTLHNGEFMTITWDGIALCATAITRPPVTLKNTDIDTTSGCTGQVGGNLQGERIMIGDATATVVENAAAEGLYDKIGGSALIVRAISDLTYTYTTPSGVKTIIVPDMVLSGLEPGGDTLDGQSTLNVTWKQHLPDGGDLADAIPAFSDTP